jgi:hypothetical protein
MQSILGQHIELPCASRNRTQLGLERAGDAFASRAHQDDVADRQRASAQDGLSGRIWIGGESMGGRRQHSTGTCDLNGNLIECKGKGKYCDGAAAKNRARRRHGLLIAGATIALTGHGSTGVHGCSSDFSSPCHVHDAGLNRTHHGPGG